MDIALQIATSTAIASVLVKLMDVWVKRKERKDNKEDREFEKVVSTLKENGETLNIVKEAVMLLMLDKFEHLAERCIQDGEITIKQFQVLSMMYQSYKSLGGDGFADNLMDMLKELKKV